MVLLKIAFRNIFRQRRRTLFTALSMFGGFILAAFFIGWADGTYNGIIDMFTRNRLGHIQIHEKDYLDRPSLYKTINDMSVINRTLEEVSGVESWTPRLYTAGLASLDDKTAGVQILGIDPVRENKTTSFNKKIIEGRAFSSASAAEVILGKGLAEILKAGVEDEIVVISQAADGSIANDIYRLIGITESGDEMTDRTAFYLPLEEAQKFLVLEGRVHEVAVTINNLNDVERIHRIIEEKLDNPRLSVEPWQEFARSFYMAMKADKEGMWIMLVVIIIIVAVGVLNTVLMSVLERQREYGVLRAVGTKPSQVIRIVLLEITFLALFCIVAGAIAGLLINTYFASHGLSLSNPITYGGIEIRAMRSEINTRSFFIPALIVLLSAGFVSLFPALKAARTDPARSMRFH
ncbi:MAG: ABC transporter permease [Candidatus Aminicenantes bacterium]|nr:ABC transporter permease [Candidatus Aminicenantes bacterium]